MQLKQIVITNNTGVEGSVTALDFAKQLAFAMRYADAPLTEAQVVILVMYLESRLS